MKQFNITGMSCAACSSRIEKEVSKLDGVESCSVNLLTNSMSVSGNVSNEIIIETVEKAGYGATPYGKNIKSSEKDTSNKKELKQIKNRLFFSLGFLILLMYISMGYTMWEFPLPAFLEGNYIAIGITQMLLSLCVIIINQKFFINGFKGVINRSPNMDTLVSLGSAASFGYSVYILFMMTINQNMLKHYIHDLYFESAAMILALITLGKMLEVRSKGKTTDALKALIKLSPKTVTVLKDGVEKVIAIEQLNVGDVFVVRPGESVAADGVVIEGQSTIDESALNGESIPVDKTIGDKVFAASINQSGVLKCRAQKVGEDTTLSQIIKMVSDTAASKAPVAKIADKVSGVFVPVVIGIALITLIIWLSLGKTIGFALSRAISVLVISCPCALGLATPVAIMVGNGVAAKNGILFKSAKVFEKMGKVNIIALDKTGTITSGKPEVTDIIPSKDISEQKLLDLAFTLEYNSEHPLAKAIVKYGESKGISPKKVTGFEALTGSGLKAVINDEEIFGGNFAFISKISKIDEELLKKSNDLSAEGKTPLFFSSGNSLLGIIAVADTIKEDSAKAIKELKQMGMQIVMITGDNERTAKAIGKLAGIEKVVSDVLPIDKSQEIERLKEQGTVAMVGDGINDAPALTKADVGIAIGAGTDIAIDAAEIVLMNSNLSDVAATVRISRKTLKIIHQNLFWAFFYNVLGIPLAAGAFISLLGWQMNPMFGAAAMSLSSFFVVSNALRLNLYDIKNNKKTINRKNKAEGKTMEKTIRIEGMMCPHCEARVKQLLEALDEVSEAKVSHTEGKAIVSLKSDIANDKLITLIESNGYKVINIE